MSDARAVRKQQQLNNLVAMVTELAHPGHTVVDFCSGGGHVGIVLAYTLPKCQVILIENKEESLVRARDRSAQLGLTNIGFIQTNLDYFTGNFNIGVALHACGVATDMVLDRCLQARAGFVISPCCYGFIQNTLKFNFPKSARFAETLSYKEHMILCRFADQTAVSLPSERRLIGKRCMGLVDLDRSWAAETHGYSVRVMTMVPEGCSPKNNMLVGIPTR
ncbi:glutathione S-transferase C-terminal domain-containing [Labeo rohita]|uniref:Glutathione S-transferase C-terminal domain-containing protein n=2 Tax=Labeo rohita TaxID=84645 RepID=A0A498LUP8_LABRO|nr:glutathione S-transferase C-terminal domain-containing [Labeo rohita]